MYYVTRTAMLIAFLAGIYWRKSSMVYLAIGGVIFAGVLMMFTGCTTQPPPPVPHLRQYLPRNAQG